MYAKLFYRSFKENSVLLEIVIDFLFALKLADGELSSEEEILISQTVAIFGIQEERYQRTIEEKEQAQERRPKKDREAYYSEILGLKGKVAPELLKQHCGNLALQYHPDKVEHLGPKLKQIAEEEMKKINEAYAFFID